MYSSYKSSSNNINTTKRNTFHPSIIRKDEQFGKMKYKKSIEWINVAMENYLKPLRQMTCQLI